MDKASLEVLMPVLATLIVFAMPVAIVFITRYFKLKHHELDIEAELQKKWTEESRRQTEARLASLENAMQAVLQIVAPRAPPTEAAKMAAAGEPPASQAQAQPQLTSQHQR